MQVQLLQVQTGAATASTSDLATLTCPGVFDFAWQPSLAAEAPPGHAAARAALALADGSCTLLDVRKSSMTAVCSAACSEGGAMALSCEWVHPARDAILASSSNGSLSRLHLGEGGLDVTAQWRGHELEAWVFAGHRHDVRTPGCTL
jgi:hypothetical protein